MGIQCSLASYVVSERYCVTAVRVHGCQWEILCYICTGAWLSERDTVLCLYGCMVVKERYCVTSVRVHGCQWEILCYVCMGAWLSVTDTVLHLYGCMPVYMCVCVCVYCKGLHVSAEILFCQQLIFHCYIKVLYRTSPRTGR